MKRKTHNQFVSELESFNQYIKAIDTYITNKIKIKFYDTRCNHYWYATPDNILRGRGCSTCNKSVKKSDCEFKNELATHKIHKGNIISLDMYKSANSTINLKCILCNHEWKSTPSRVLNENKGCKKCSHKIPKNKLSEIEFKRKLFEKRSNEIELIDSYTISSKITKFKDNKCGHIFETTPDRILHSYTSCNICNLSIKKSNKEFELELSKHEIHKGNIINVEPYVSASHKILFKDKECNHEPWYAIPSNILRGTGCPKCSNLRVSKISNLVFSSLKNKLDIEIMFGIENELLITKNNKKYYYDSFIPSSNTIIEYHGKCWHSHPIIIQDGLYDTYEKLKSRDDLKRNIAIDSGYNFIEIYELDYNNYIDVVDTLYEYLNSNTINNKLSVNGVYHSNFP